MTHSIPEAQAVADPHAARHGAAHRRLEARSRAADRPDPDEAALRALGDEGVLAMVCDSTNVFEPGRTGSEASLRPDLRRLIAGCSQRVVVTCFASNIARIASIAAAAQDAGRVVLLSAAR